MERETPNSSNPPFVIYSGQLLRFKNVTFVVTHKSPNGEWALTLTDAGIKTFTYERFRSVQKEYSGLYTVEAIHKTFRPC